MPRVLEDRTGDTAAAGPARETPVQQESPGKDPPVWPIHRKEEVGCGRGELRGPCWAHGASTRPTVGGTPQDRGDFPSSQ